MIFYTSDIHVHHRNIVDYTERKQVTDREQHTAWLFDLWNKQVSPTDVVYHLGDFSFSTKYREIAEFVSGLNGCKYFIKGNHDDSKILDMLSSDGFIDGWADYKEVKINNNHVCLFHFPVTAWHRQGRGGWHLHGHCHGSFQGKGKILDVGLDNAFNLFSEHRFFTEKDIESFMNSREVIVVDHHKNTVKEK